ncbi:MAG: alpha-L-fucosidase, partial [Kiritimatiellia bacterium]|nr:alpha-L-fucosidase [Kiritimatiellia bacterium]
MTATRKTRLTGLGVALLLSAARLTPAAPAPALANDPARCEAFMDWGVGLFIHWSLDSELGSVISHSMVGASDDYLERYIRELPKFFNPQEYRPEEWARLA